VIWNWLEKKLLEQLNHRQHHGQRQSASMWSYVYICRIKVSHWVVLLLFNDLPDINVHKAFGDVWIQSMNADTHYTQSAFHISIHLN